MTPPASAVASADRRSQRTERRRPRRRLRHNRHLVDLLTASQRWKLRGLIALWALSTMWACAWWIRPGNWSSDTGMAINSALLAIELLVLPVWFYSWLWRMKRPDQRLPVPLLRTAMIVTKAPSEPWPLVRVTLSAMLTQDFPHPYDVWLADERPSAETRAWCREHGVRISTREGVSAYHRPDWPRRTRCKEGNLAFFYDMWGYRLYDVVAQLDADHVPSRTYLQHMVRPFADEVVGYVAAPSICDRNARRSWAARGRLYAEAVLHGPMQAGHSGGYAPSCIGSHYAVRTAALQEVGGLGPELAEDFTTTLMMSSYGWQGVFAVQAEAHGDGPECLEDGMTQEFQWSRSMMNVLLGVSRRYWDGLSLRAKLRLGFCELWYPLFGLLMLASVILPVAAIVTRTPLMEVGLGDFYRHVAPPMAALIATVLWLRTLDWLRPRTALAVSWEMALFQLVRWPWALLGCAHAVAGRVIGRDFAFKVTPKGEARMRPLPAKVVTPYLVLSLFSALPALLRLDAGPAGGYVTLSLINAGLYLAAAVAIVVLHVREHPRSLRRSALAAVTPRIATTALFAAVIVGGIAFPGGWNEPSGAKAAAPAPWPVRSNDTRIGVTSAALAKNATTRWKQRDLRQVNSFERSVRAHAAIVQWFSDWRRNASLEQLRAVARRGSTPQISWEPWDQSVGAFRPQPRYTLAAIIAGEHDAYIHAYARRLKEFGNPVFLRFAQEMNGNWYPWAEDANGNRPGEYRRMWRHVHDIFTAEGATNVKWVWCPVTRPVRYSQYPGNKYVDVVALSGFNGGKELPWGGWRTFRKIFNDQLTSLRRLAPGKPVQISETGSAERGGNKGVWIRDMFAYVRAHPWIRSVLWFDLKKQADWRVATSRRARLAFARGAASLSRRR
jgi:cellulose synthase (UDP-forming)